MKEGRERVEVRYEGRVQGVGFRYTVVELASDFNVTGFVRNEPDGSVSLVAEGADRELRGLLDAVDKSHLDRYITRRRLAWSAGRGEFASFSVRYDD